jgi:hypothetical protein
MGVAFVFNEAPTRNVLFEKYQKSLLEKIEEEEYFD